MSLRHQLVVKSTENDLYFRVEIKESWLVCVFSSRPPKSDQIATISDQIMTIGDQIATKQRPNSDLQRSHAGCYRFGDQYICTRTKKWPFQGSRFWLVYTNFGCTHVSCAMYKENHNHRGAKHPCGFLCISHRKQVYTKNG
jgi:hypothetical protein